MGYYFAYRDVQTQREAGMAQQLFVSQFSGVMLSAGLYVVNFLVVMVTVLTSVGAIASEISSQTIHALASKPIRRWEIVLGKWIGLGVMLTIYTLVLALSLMLSVRLIGGYTPNNPIPALGILVLEGLTVLSVTLLGSSLMSTLANGVVVFMLYGVAFVGGWVEQIGTLASSPTAWWYCHCVGKGDSAARAVAQRVRRALLNQRPIVAGLDVGLIRMQPGGGPPQRQEDTGSPVVDLVSVYWATANS